jgi:hypothetical protein
MIYINGSVLTDVVVVLEVQLGCDGVIVAGEGILIHRRERREETG